MEMQPQQAKVPWKIILPGIAAMVVLSLCVVAVILTAGSRMIFSGEGEPRAETANQARTEGVVKPEAEGGDSSRPEDAEGGRLQLATEAAQLAVEAAQLATYTGWVEVQRDDGTWAAAEAGQALQAGQRLRTGELSSAEVIFFDGSRARLLANSELSIDELQWREKSDQRTILLTQWAGESEHEVAENKKAGSRYEVRTPAGSAEARGTIFLVAVSPEQTARYVVIEGVVAVTHLEVTVLVNGGEATIVYLDQPPMQPFARVTVEGLVSQVGDTWIAGGQSFIVDGQTAVVGDPQLGDWVRIEGRIGQDQARIADWIILLRRSPADRFQLRGVVEAIGEVEWLVNGQTVLISAGTVIDDGIQTGDAVQVAGELLPGGSLQAEEIRKIPPDLGLPLEFTGVLQEMGTEIWRVSGLDIRITEDTLLAQNLETGASVRVRGWIQDTGAITAASILLAGEEEQSFEITGVLESREPWQVAGVGFEATDWTEMDGDLAVGELVRVEGQITGDGRWIASEIRRVAERSTRLVLVGTVMAIDPWIVSSIPLTVTAETVIEGEITPGMLVRVEILLLPGGEWQVLRIQGLESAVTLPVCQEILATVVRVKKEDIELFGWPALDLGEGIQVDGFLRPDSVVRVQLCFTVEGTIEVTYIIVIDQLEFEPDPDDEPGMGGHKVDICHKPDKKKGGHTINIDQAAIPAHLGHGDYLGPCR